MNSSIFVKYIILPDDVEMVTAEDIAVVSVQEPKKEEVVVEEEVLEEGAGDEEGAEGDVAQEGEEQEKPSSDGDEKPAEETKE